MPNTAVKHPAKYTPAIMHKFRELLPAEGLVLDPFAGTGLIHELATPTRMTIGIEIEPEWATIRPRTLVGDSTSLPLRDKCADVIATSPTYGNRFADSHSARDGSIRRGYTHDLRDMTGDEDRKLHPNNTGQMHWGPKYRDFHEKIWQECARVHRSEGIFLFNCKNHIKNHKEQMVTEWHLDVLRGLGYEVQELHLIPVTGNGFGANGKSRIDHEVVARLVKL